MIINRVIIQFAFTAIIIFGGTLIIHYFKSGDLLLDQLIGALVGIILLIFSLIWRRKYKHS